MTTRTSFKKGHAVSAETRAKISAAAKGNQRCLGHRHSEAAKVAMADAARGRRCSDETKEKLRQANLGKHLTIEVRQKISKANAGAKNSFWKGGVSLKNKTERQLAMHLLPYKVWREAVFARDNYTCVCCNKRGVELNADHIMSWAEYPALRYGVSNGRTLCVGCHRRTDSYGNRNKPYGLSRVGK